MPDIVDFLNHQGPARSSERQHPGNGARRIKELERQIADLKQELRELEREAAGPGEPR